MTASSRLEELRRRVQLDPASLSFATLAEEYRKAGQYDEAVRSCRLGLQHHPTYHSARTTLACALVELEEYEAAGAEFEQVLSVAPDNLRARKGFAHLLERQGHLSQALTQLRIALSLVPQDPDLPQAIATLEHDLDRRLVQVTPVSPSQEPTSPLEVARQVARLRGFLAAIERAKVTTRPSPTGPERDLTIAGSPSLEPEVTIVPQG